MLGRFKIALAGALLAALLAAPAMAQTTGVALEDGNYCFFGGDGVYQANGKTFIIAEGKVVVREEGKPDLEMPLYESAESDAVVMDRGEEPVQLYVETREGAKVRAADADGEAHLVEEPAAVYTGMEVTSGAAGSADPEVYVPYAPFGLRCDAEADALYYHGQRVRVFEDSYPVGDQGCAAIMHLDDAGTVDVRALRDLTQKVCNADGSENPGGVLTGLEALSAEEFAARDYAALCNPTIEATATEITVSVVEEEEVAIQDEDATEAAAEGGSVRWYIADVDGEVSVEAGAAAEPAAEGGAAKREATATEDAPRSPEERRENYAPYAAFGLDYDAEADALYCQGQRVRFFQDVRQSNGAAAGSGRFQGVITQLADEDGAVDVYTIRDYEQPDANGDGKLIGIRVEDAR